MELPGVTHAEVIRRMQTEIAQFGSKAQAARMWKITPQLLDYVLKGERNIGPKLLRALKLKRTTIVIHRYQPAAQPVVETATKVPARGLRSNLPVGGERIDPD